MNTETGAVVAHRAGQPRTPREPAWRALIAVTTCNREAYLRRCLPFLARATVEHPSLALLVSLDGDEPATRSLCERWQVPLLYSDSREGVGLSKNRVLERFPEFDYYFFLEDDVEVTDASVFPAHVALAQGLGMHHMSLFEPRRAREVVASSSLLGQHILHCQYGSADFNFFTRHGLERVGGWHPEFANYKRWGHTEHSYRFSRSGLAPAPFNIAVSLSRMCAWHSPPSVTQVAGITFDTMEIAAPERELMEQELEFVPLQTLAPYHYNQVPIEPAERLAATLTGDEMYPLLVDAERRRARSDYLVWRFRNDRNPLRRLWAGTFAGMVAPSNPEWRHEVKSVFQRHG